MSLKRSQIKEILSEAGVTTEHMDEAINKIIAGHNATVEALKDDIEELKKGSKDYADLQTKFNEQSKQLETAQNQLKEVEDYEGKYKTTKAEYDKYKADIDGKEKKAKPDTIFKEWLKEQGYSETGANKIVKYGGFIPEFDKDGNIKNSDKLSESIKGEWGEYQETKHVEGAKTSNPPANAGGKSTKTKAEIMAIKDAAERQQAIKDNPALFGIE